MSLYTRYLRWFVALTVSLGISAPVAALERATPDKSQAADVTKPGDAKAGHKQEQDGKNGQGGNPDNAAPAQPRQASQTNEDMTINPAQPDFVIINLPTTLRVPKFKSAFRVTHRFTRPLGQGDFGDLISDFFGIDTGALIGLEYRFGIMPGTQIGIHRTSSRTIQFFAQYDVSQQGKRLPVGLAAIATVDGTNNFKDSYSPGLGAIVSYAMREHVALYAEPMWVNNTNPLPSELVDHNDTFFVGLGARVRVRSTVYLVGEFTPRAAGYRPGVSHGAFAVEKRVGGHVFQLNFSNSFGTTMDQIARGGNRNDDWYLGFNISRKFF